MVIDPQVLKKHGKDLDAVDPEQLVGGKSLFKMG
jgi:hypothetical protein